MRFAEMDNFRSEQYDFVPRERRGQIWQVIFAFTATIILIIASAYAPVFKRMELYTPMITVAVIVALCLFVIYRKQNSLDLVMSTEYQNMLFSQAFSIGASFSMILRRDGSIVHADEGVEKVFPRFRLGQSQLLDAVLEHGMVRQNDRERILGAIHSSSSDRLVFPVTDYDGLKRDYILTVEPLPRPSGFLLVRAREYLGQRSGLQMLPDMLSATSIDKLDHLLATTGVAHYTTDAYGRLEYINPAMERLAGYESGEIVESKLSLHHLLFSMGGHALTEESHLQDFTGEIVLVHKRGAHLAGMVQQSIVRDAAGKLIGATGTIVAQTLA
jgi:PAS domain S-box-containing protein